MWPLTDTVPKGLLPVAGVPFIELQFRLLAEVGVEEVILAIGTSHESAWRTYAEGTTSPVVHLAVEQSKLDTAGPLVAVRDQLDDRFLVLNGDVVLEGSLGQFVEDAPDLPAVLSLVGVEDTSAYGVVVTNDLGKVERFIEKPPPGTAPTNAVNAGMYLMSRSVFDAYDEGALSFEQTVFPSLVEQGLLGGVKIDGVWLDIGTPPLYLQTHRDVAAGNSRLVNMEPAHHGIGANVAGDLDGNWNFIGPGAVVEEGARVRESIVLAGATIRSGSVVEDSIVGWNAVVENARISDTTVIGAGAVVGEGCELTAAVRIGPGSSLSARSVTFEPPS
ncbi:MAG: NDP-sugar synthase [Acidimicrobiia bacterium]|nr:NDP-sugar synthase [Acidimicrobiia bacterium]NNL27289.1 NDP-sugar synthase [Acidimicrobiia bacterium]